MAMKIRAYPDGRVVYESIVNGVRQIFTTFKDGTSKITVEKVNG